MGDCFGCKYAEKCDISGVGCPKVSPTVIIHRKETVTIAYRPTCTYPNPRGVDGDRIKPKPKRKRRERNRKNKD